MIISREHKPSRALVVRRLRVERALSMAGLEAEYDKRDTAHAYAKVILRTFEDPDYRLVLIMHVTAQTLEMEARLESRSNICDQTYWRQEGFFEFADAPVKLISGWDCWQMKDKLNLQNLRRLLRWAAQRAKTAEQPTSRTDALF